jgi:predicted nucleic acid-binding Zn ribbon protein
VGWKGAGAFSREASGSAKQICGRTGAAFRRVFGEIAVVTGFYSQLCRSF